MNNTMVFKRYELKYLLSEKQYHDLKNLMINYMELDQFKKHTINNIYFDTPDFLLIRRSMEKPCYKEKLRVRCYGDFNENSTVFIELKKKYNGVVYKRRLTLPQSQAVDFLVNSKPLENPTQISKEIEYFLNHYKTLAPAVALNYEREAFFGLTNESFRMTFDHNIRVNYNKDNLYSKNQFVPVLQDKKILLEVKTSLGIPTWLLEFFSENKIYKASFSKYGKAYENSLMVKGKGDKANVA